MSTTRRKVLIVEDDPVTAKAHRNRISAAGYDVQVATDGEQALQELQSFRPDALLLDVNLPGRSGLDVLKTIRASPEFQKLPVFVFSVTVDDALMAKCTSAGATAVVEKWNLTSSVLLENLATALR